MSIIDINNLTRYLNHLPEQLQVSIIDRIKQSLIALDELNFPIRAVVVGGGWKYQEITISDNRLMGDIDIFIFSNWLPFYWQRILKLRQTINENQNIKIHYQGVIPWFFAKSKTLWSYRLKYEGIVIQGDEKVLDKITALKDNIPATEAIRRLFQVLIVQLQLFETRRYYSEKEIEPYQAAKFYLSAGDAYLIYAKELAPSYRERKNAISSVSSKLGLHPNLISRIQAGYDIKIDYNTLPQYNYRFNFNLPQAKKDCLNIINDILARYLKSTDSLEKKLAILNQEFSSNYLINSIYYLSIKKLTGIKPRALAIIFKLKVPELYKIAIYHEMKEWDKRDKILDKYFYVNRFTDELLIKMFELWPTPATIEIK